MFACFSRCKCVDDVPYRIKLNYQGGEQRLAVDTEQRGRGRIFYDFSLEPLFSSNVEISRSLRPCEILFLSWAPSLRSKRFRLHWFQSKETEQGSVVETLFLNLLPLVRERLKNPVESKANYYLFLHSLSRNLVKET